MADQDRLTPGPSLRDEVRRSFPSLFEQMGFHFIDIGDDYFGNIAIARSKNLLLRFIRDRADFFLDIGTPSLPNRWIPFYRVLDKLKQSNVITAEFKYSNKMNVVSKLLREYLPFVEC